MSDIPSYNSSHRAFLQAFFSKPVMTFETAKPILAAILTAHHDRPTLPNDITFVEFDTYMHTVNSALSPFAYEIRSLHPQTAATRTPEAALYALVNTASDPQTQLATARAPDDIAFVKRVLDAMFDANNTPARETCAVRVMDAVRLAKAPPSRTANGGAEQSQAADDDDDGSRAGAAAAAQTQAPASASASSLTLERAEKVLDELVVEQWLERSADGWLSLAPRGLMELGRWLEETYNDAEPDEEDETAAAWKRIKTCEGCRQIVTVGQRCENQECLCRLHDFCVQTFFRGQSVRKCPFCSEEWTGSSLVGELAARNRSRRSDGAASRR